MNNRSAFNPAWWLKNPHAQTIWPNTAAKPKTPRVTREQLELKDGDFLEILWNDFPADPKKPLLIVFHGLEGSIRSAYAASLLPFMAQNQQAAVLLHFRNCGEQINRLPRSYHSGETGDIGWLIQHLQMRGFEQLYAVGFSLGGNALLKYLGETGSMSQLQAAIAVSAPMRLDLCADRMDQGLSRIYQKDLLDRLRRKVQRKQHILEEAGFQIPNLHKIQNFRQFDAQLTAPLHGYIDDVDYYQRCSSRQYLGEIQTPTLILHAQDDPFMTPGVIPKEAELSNSVMLELSEHGGHVGFIDGGTPFTPHRWVNGRLLRFMRGSSEQ